jgi:hypothetical protein
MDVINATDDIVERAANKLVGLMFQFGGIPQLVQVQKPELLVVLQPWLTTLGASVDLVDRLKSAEEFRLGMMQFMGRA